MYPLWAASYLNYKLLKERIKDILAVRDNPETSSVLSAKKNIFQVSAAHCQAPQAALTVIRRSVGKTCCNMHAWLAHR